MKHPHHEHDHPHGPQHAKPQTLTGIYRQPIFSPKGELEGVLLDVDGAPTQVVLDPHEQATDFSGVSVGQKLQLKAAPAKPSPKGEAAHAVFHLHELSSVDGKKHGAAEAVRKLFKGKVERLNYAKHGEPNGVILDSGDFIHLRPQGFRDAQLKVGDDVRAHGDARPMTSGGFVVEATEVNDVEIEAKKPKPHKPHHPPAPHH